MDVISICLHVIYIMHVSLKYRHTKNYQNGQKLSKIYWNKRLQIKGIGVLIMAYAWDVYCFLFKKEHFIIMPVREDIYPRG